MATHNQVRVIGYLLHDITVNGQEGAYTAVFQIRTTHRWTDDIYEHRQFEDILVFYDDNSPNGLMQRVLSLKQYDLVDIKGVFNVMVINKASVCEECGMTNVKHNATATFVYPISLMKRGNLKVDSEYSESLPDEILQKHFKEISNQVLLIGTLVREPELLGTEANPCCRYMLGVDRKYFIRSQSKTTADYPWVYTFGIQAQRDYDHLKKGADILVDGFIRNREVQNNMICEYCGKEYQFRDVATEFIPYSVEYLSGYMTDLEISQKKLAEDRMRAMELKHALS